MRAKTWAVAACAGLITTVAVTAQPPKTGTVKPASGEVGAPAKAAEPTKATAEGLTAVLGDCRTALGKVRDYSCTFTRQESRNGTVGAEQVAEMKVRSAPVGVYARFARPDAIAGMEVAYSAARKLAKVKYRPAGVEGAKGFRSISPDDTKFLSENRHPVPAWTMSALLERVAASVAREKGLNNPVEVFTSEHQFAGRNVTKYEVFTRRPHAFRTAHKMVVYVDQQTKLPVRFEMYDQPKGGATTGELLEAYSFTDLKLNTGIGEATFDV